MDAQNEHLDELAEQARCYDYDENEVTYDTALVDVRCLQALAEAFPPEDDELALFLRTLMTQEDRDMWNWRFCKRTLDPMPSSSRLHTSDSGSDRNIVG